jgi:hypothetical protein
MTTMTKHEEPKAYQAVEDTPRPIVTPSGAAITSRLTAHISGTRSARALSRLSVTLRQRERRDPAVSCTKRSEGGSRW